MTRIAWALNIIAGLVFLAFFFVITERAPPQCINYTADMAILVACAFAMSGAVDFVRQDHSRYAATLAGGTIALLGYAALAHGWVF